MEMVSAMVHQLTKNLTEKQIEESGFDNILLTTPLAFIRKLQQDFPGGQSILLQKAIF